MVGLQLIISRSKWMALQYRLSSLESDARKSKTSSHFEEKTEVTGADEGDRTSVTLSPQIEGEGEGAVLLLSDWGEAV